MNAPLVSSATEQPLLQAPGSSVTPDANDALADAVVDHSSMHRACDIENQYIQDDGQVESSDSIQSGADEAAAAALMPVLAGVPPDTRKNDFCVPLLPSMYKSICPNFCGYSVPMQVLQDVMLAVQGQAVARDMLLARGAFEVLNQATSGACIDLQLVCVQIHEHPAGLSFGVVGQPERLSLPLLNSAKLVFEGQLCR